MLIDGTWRDLQKPKAREEEPWKKKKGSKEGKKK